jgi:L-alanine-DL-glutamate epimerase-like enolase superfamily enzyme
MVRKYFEPALIGMDLEETGLVLQTLHQIRYGHPLTKAALETALFDALGKLYRVPLYRLLGGPYRGEIELVGGLGLDLGPESIGERAGQLRRDGFHTFKIKIGGKDRGRDVARVGAVRDAVGAEPTIRVDGNAAYSFSEAREILTELSRFISPMPSNAAQGDLKSLADLRRAVGIPIAAQESVSSRKTRLRCLKSKRRTY